MKEADLIVGHTYYRLGFADRDLTMPSVEPLIYLGMAELDDGQSMHALQDTVSYMRFGSALEQPQADEAVAVRLVERTSIESEVLSVAEISHEIAAAAARAKSLGDPVLPVIRKGWKSAS